MPREGSRAWEKREKRRAKQRAALEGCGKYRFKNITMSDLVLSKQAADGKTIVRPGETFVGDSYYMKFVPTEIIVAETLQEVPLDAPSVDKELEKMQNLEHPPKEVITIQETLEVKEGVESKERVKLTPEILAAARADGKSFGVIAREYGYSITYVSKACKKHGIE